MPPITTAVPEAMALRVPATIQSAMRYLLAALLLLTACGGSSSTPQPTVPHYLPLEQQAGIPVIEILAPFDSQTTPQEPNTLESGLSLTPGAWPFSWTPIAGADSYTLFVYDVTGIPTRQRDSMSTYTEIPTAETTATIDLSGEPLDGVTPRLYYFEVAAFDGFELVGQSESWAIQVGPG